MRTVLPFTTGIIFIFVRFTFEISTENRNKEQYGAAEMTSWIRRQPTIKGGSNPFYEAEVVKGPLRTSWTGLSSLGDEDMCLGKRKQPLAKRRGWGKRMVSGGGHQRSAAKGKEGMDVSRIEGRRLEKRQTAAAAESMCDYWENETKNRIYNAVQVGYYSIIYLLIPQLIHSFIHNDFTHSLVQILADH